MATLNIIPPRLDLVVYGGDDSRIAFTLTSNDDPYEFVGTQKAQVRLDANSVDAWDLEVELDTQVDGKAYLLIPSEVAAELVVDAELTSKYVGDQLVTAPMFTGVWDWQYTNGDEVKTLVFGSIVIIGEVTR